ncbi:MAG: 8-oxo-(d)GTP phosphatase [Pseudonocardiales bacterium]|nr:8-oxo-(d)GTP phosphatase [Pseudonocardiales bacterium]
MPKTRIDAAGGVVWRGGQRAVEVAVVHRARYDDWSLPKGKLEQGETPLAAAVREVAEEIGSTVAVSRRLRRVQYDVPPVRDGDGPARKVVAFWAMRHLSGTFAPSDEVDELQWLTPDDAALRLQYATDRSVLTDFAALPVPDAVVILLRHARAGRRVDWPGDDALRPLDDFGRAQARGLAGFLTSFGPDAVISADRARCIETVTPFAQAAHVPLQIDPAFDDEAYATSAGAVRTALYALAKPGRVTVVCSQGLTISSLVEDVAVHVSDSDTRKGAAWVLSFVDGDVIASEYYDDPAGLR